MGLAESVNGVAIMGRIALVFDKAVSARFQGVHCQLQSSSRNRSQGFEPTAARVKSNAGNIMGNYVNALALLLRTYPPPFHLS